VVLGDEEKLDGTKKKKSLSHQKEGDALESKKQR